jgi:hypothetical protein
MIRTVLASPWFPLSYWVATLAAVTVVAHHKSLKLIRGKHNPKTVVSTPARVDLTSSIAQVRPDAPITPAISRLPNYWYPGISVLRLPELSLPRSQREVAKNEILTSREVQPLETPPITMLSIRADTVPS